MPELAEIARFAKDLNDIIDGSKLTIVRNNLEDKFSSKMSPSDAIQEVNKNIGQKVNFLSTGKSLLMTLPRENKLLNFKLGMTGNFQTKLKNGFDKHVFWTFGFSNNKVIYYVDPRRFGSVSLQRGVEEKARELSLGGFDGKSFKIRELGRIYKYLCQKMKLSRTARITWLLNTGKYTGVGNYMANEALGALNLNPFKPFRNYKEVIMTLKTCQDVAKNSFSKGGFSFGGGYFMLNGESGSFEGDFYQAPEIERQIFKNRPVYSKYRAEKQ